MNAPLKNGDVQYPTVPVRHVYRSSLLLHLFGIWAARPIHGIRRFCELLGRWSFTICRCKPQKLTAFEAIFGDLDGSTQNSRLQFFNMKMQLKKQTAGCSWLQFSHKKAKTTNNRPLLRWGQGHTYTKAIGVTWHFVENLMFYMFACWLKTANELHPYIDLQNRCKECKISSLEVDIQPSPVRVTSISKYLPEHWSKCEYLWKIETWKSSTLPRLGHIRREVHHQWDHHAKHSLPGHKTPNQLVEDVGNSPAETSHKPKNQPVFCAPCLLCGNVTGL